MTIPEKAPRMQSTKPSLGAVLTGVIVLLIYAAVFLLEQMNLITLFKERRVMVLLPNKSFVLWVGYSMLLLVLVT